MLFDDDEKDSRRPRRPQRRRQEPEDDFDDEDRDDGSPWKALVRFYMILTPISAVAAFGASFLFVTLVPLNAPAGPGKDQPVAQLPPPVIEEREQKKRQPPKVDVPPDTNPKPKPEEKVKPPVKNPYEGLVVDKLDVDSHKVIPALVWGENGTVYVLEKDGTLRHLGAQLKELRSNRVAQDASWLSMSRLGLLVSTSKGVVIADPETLEPKGEIALPQPTVGYRAVSARTLDYAYAGSSILDPLLVLDLKKAAIVNKFLSAQAPVKGVKFALPVVTPDGKYLITQGSGGMYRFRITGGLFFDGSSAAIASGEGEIQISVDSRFVCLPTKGGNSPLPGAVAGTGHTTYVFAVNNFNAPVGALNLGTHPTAVGFDPASKRIYGQNSEYQLIVCNERGEKEREYTFPGIFVRQFLVAPGGGRLLILTLNHLFDVGLTQLR